MVAVTSRSGECRGRSRGGMQPGWHSASTCSPQPTGKIIERLANVKAFLSCHPEACRHAKPCSGVTTTALGTCCHCRAGSPGPTTERGTPGQPQPRRAGQERCPSQEGLHAMQERPGQGHPSAEQGSLREAGVCAGQGMGFNFHTPHTELRDFPGKPMQSIFTRW